MISLLDLTPSTQYSVAQTLVNDTYASLGMKRIEHAWSIQGYIACMYALMYVYMYVCMYVCNVRVLIIICVHYVHVICLSFVIQSLISNNIKLINIHKNLMVLIKNFV